MNFKCPHGSVYIRAGELKKSKKGDKQKFNKKLNDAGYRGDFNKAWKDYCAIKPPKD